MKSINLIMMEHYPYDITELRTFLAGLNSKREVLAKGNLQPLEYRLLYLRTSET